MTNAKIYRVDGGMVLIDEVENVSHDYNEEDYIRECREDAETLKTEEKIEWLKYIEEKQIVVELC